MRTLGRWPLFLSVTIVVAVLPVAPAAATTRVADAAQSKDYVVILTENASVAAKVNKEESLGNDVNDVFSSKVKGFVAELDPTDIRRLKKDPQVLVVEPNATFSEIGRAHV